MTASTKAPAAKRQLNDQARTSADAPQAASWWQSTTFRLGMLSAIGLWMAFPPVGWWVLAWLAPCGWIHLIRRPQLDGPRPRLCVYLVGFAYWLLQIQWLRLPHMGAALGWPVLAAYLALYFCAFVMVSRVLVHRAKLPSLIVVPVVWTAMEVVRSYLFTGWALVLLGHSQVTCLPIIQLAEWTGAYGVGCLVMLFAAGLEQAFCGILARATTRNSANNQEPRANWLPLVVAGSIVMAVYVWGTQRLDHEFSSPASVSVAIIQGDLDTVFGPDKQNRIGRAFIKYRQLTAQAVKQHDVDLVIWPESMFRGHFLRHDPGLEDFGFEGDNMTLSEKAQLSDAEARTVLRPFDTPCLVGTRTIMVGETDNREYNTAAWFNREGQIQDAYHKVHPVMFGEYIPLGDVFPWLYTFTPMHGGLTPGDGPKAFSIAGVSLAPNICFENTVPHLVRQHVRQLQQSDTPVDVLVTLTNDGWFWGSSLLDLHLACGVFRAVECRRPMLIAANTGFSANIDAGGRVLGRGPRRQTGIVLADVGRSKGEVSPYVRWGDWFGFGTVLASILGLCVGLLRPPAEPPVSVND